MLGSFTDIWTPVGCLSAHNPMAVAVTARGALPLSFNTNQRFTVEYSDTLP